MFGELGIFPSIPDLESKESGSISIGIAPSARADYLRFKFGLDGYPNMVEDSISAYCPISLTATPPEARPILAHRQEVLLDVLKRAGLTGYDPKSAPFSPDIDLNLLPNRITYEDKGRVLGSRYLVGHNIIPSTGYGEEIQIASEFNKVSVVLMDRNIRISRMQPVRTIYLEYEDFDRQVDEFVEVFKFLQQFEPGMGFNGKLPVLIGQNKDGEIVDLEQAVYEKFPNLQYMYKGEIPIVKLRVENPGIFYENVN